MICATIYGYTAGDPKASYVDTVGGSGGTEQHTEYSLGTVNITDGTFNIYVQDADLLGTGYNFFGWAWVRLVSTNDQTMITMTSSSPTMIFDGDEDGIFGEPGDDLKPLVGNTMSIMALDLSEGTDVDIIATDDLGQTGYNTYTILPPGCEGDDDCDTICNPGESAPDCTGSDNCPDIYNPSQEDTYPPGGNGIGDVCDCEGNFDCDVDCDGNDAFDFKSDFGRSTLSNPCESGNPCNGDMDCDQDVDGGDAFLFKKDFGRSSLGNPCPVCTAGTAWCTYP